VASCKGDRYQVRKSKICTNRRAVTKWIARRQAPTVTAMDQTERYSKAKHEIRIALGKPLPLGALPVDGGVNFAIFSRHAEAIELCLYSPATSLKPYFTVKLDARWHRSGDIWHVWLSGVGPGTCYAYRADGPFQPERGLRFNRHRLLVDPFATALAGTSLWNFSRARPYDESSPLKDLSFSTDDNSPWVAKSVVAETDFDWQGDRPLSHPWSGTIIYETHVRGLTIHPSSGVRHPGTFRGLIEKIPYFKNLGVTALELLPVQEFNGGELVSINPLTGERLRNYWGYGTIAFFAPKESYSSAGGPGAQLREFKEMVRALHRADIEVILDVVFNHTAEGDELGPTLSFRGLDNPIYYLLDVDPRLYKNYSGCGNTVNCNHPIVRSFIHDCLRYWVVEMHVDGFRFDLASVLGRDANGEMLSNPPLLESIAEDPILRDVKLIAEAWDAAGAYQVGSFPGNRWSEWNGHYRDDIRRFWRGEPGLASTLASRLCGSADIYARSGKEPIHSINFVTCHDGFTLNDLVTYEEKHNEGNSEGNRDGTNLNYSCNYGVEGETDDSAVETVRLRQIKNMTATLLLSRGVPMLLGGDEFRRTQRGNNNAYCQDNEISWYDWRLRERHREVHRFARAMIALRARHPVLSGQIFYKQEEVVWFNTEGSYPDWNAIGSRVGSIISGAAESLCLLFNASPGVAEFRLPPAVSVGAWHILVDTAAPPPYDICETAAVETRALLPDPAKYVAQPRSLIVLLRRAV